MAETFRDAFIRMMQETGLSIREVADRSGVSYEQLKKLNQRQDAKTNVEDARRIAALAFGVTLDQMYEDQAVRGHIELIDLYSQLPDDARQLLLMSAKGMCDGLGQPPAKSTSKAKQLKA